MSWEKKSDILYTLFRFINKKVSLVVLLNRNPKGLFCVTASKLLRTNMVFIIDNSSLYNSYRIYISNDKIQILKYHHLSAYDRCILAVIVLEAFPLLLAVEKVMVLVVR